MNTLENYIQQVLGIKPKFLTLSKPLLNRLPFFITAGYKVETMQLFDRTICLLIAGNENEFTPDQLSKHRDITTQQLNVPIVFVFNRIASYNRKRYIDRKINFIVPNNQLFIPELMMDFRKTNEFVVIQPKEVSPMAQLVLLYHLQKEDLSGKTIKHIAEIFGSSYLKMNRAINNLKSLELCNLQGGKEKVIQFDTKKRTVWLKALPFLINPIKKTLYTNSILNQTMCGINALAHYTMLNDERRKYYAITEVEFKKLSVVSDKNFGENKIELWKYDPNILAINGFIDRLSLYLQFKEDEDERIEMALETLIEQVLW